MSPSSMASAPQFYSNYTYFPSDFTDLPTPPYASSSAIENAIWGQYNFVPSLDNFGVSMDCDTIPSSWMPTFSEQMVGISDLGVPEISEFNTSFYGGGTNGVFQSFSGGYQPHIGEFGEECCGIVEDVKPLACPNTARENWVIQGNQMGAVEENIKVGRYSEEERKERILRYLRKRNQRNFNKTIKYACRKTLADRRVRVRGRFARNNELCEGEMTMKKIEIPQQDQDLYGGDSTQFQLKNDEEDWLQEAMESLAFFTHSSPDDV